MEEVKANPDYEFPTNFIPIRVEKKDFDFARSQINKYVTPRTKKFLELHKDLKDEVLHFLREEGEEKSYWFDTPREWKYFIERRVGSIGKGRSWEDKDRIREEWDYNYFKGFWDKYISPFVDLSVANDYVNRCKKGVSATLEPFFKEEI
jgi:hypothetical protein